jgi:catechol 2,3-dioxygenase-like lactoylglutathione lyase family enzyme
MAKVAGVILLVDNIEKSVAFYEKLGFITSKEVPGTATTLKLGDFWLELLHKSKVVSEEYGEDVESPHKGAGLYLQIQVDDTDAFYDTVTKNEIVPSGIPKNYPWNQREFIIIDPDGYKIAFFNPI